MILILTDPTAGGTFLIWSLHYLAGHDTYFRVLSGQEVPLVHDPVAGINAHKFRPNHSLRVDDVYNFTTILENTPTENFHHLYIQNLEDQPRNEQNFHAETKIAIDHIRQKFQSTILIDNHNPLYYVTFQPRTLLHKHHDPNVRNTSAEEQLEDFITYFFRDSVEKWRSLGLNEIWDQREFLALNLESIVRSKKMRDNVDLTLPYFHLETQDLFTSFDTTIEELFSFLDLRIRDDRRDQWYKIYNKWKKIHYQKIRFCWYFEEIVDSILHGHNLDLTRFNLDIVQEAYIQNHFIYKHDLNFQTFNLGKFQNAQQLHRLLEKNIHNNHIKE